MLARLAKLFNTWKAYLLARPEQGAWRFARIWTFLRDVSVAAYILFLLHDLMIRVLGSFVAPVFLGFRFPALPYADAFLFFALFLGVWRMIGDPPWRLRLRLPGLALIVGFGMLSGAFMWLNSGEFFKLIIIKGILLPLIVYVMGVLSGMDMRQFRWVFGVTAVINALVSLIIVTTWYDGYVELVTLADAFLPTNFAIYHSIFRHAGLSIPTGFVVSRLNYMTLFSIFGWLCLHQYLYEAVRRRYKALLLVGIVISAACVMLTFSRAGIVAFLFASVVIIGRYGLEAHRQGKVTEIRNLYWLGGTLTLCIVALLVYNTVLKESSIHADVLSTGTLTSEDGGRFGMWERVIDKINESNGWLLGIGSNYSSSYSVAFNNSREQTWSEFRLVTVDNQYLHLVLQGGIFALLGYVLAMYLLLRQLARYKQWMWFAGLLACLLIDINLRSGSLTQVFVCLAAGATCAQQAALEGTPLLAKAQLAKGAIHWPAIGAASSAALE